MRSRRILYLIPIAAIAATVVLAVLCFVHARDAAQQVFAGFFFQRSGYVAATQRGSWPGPAAGVTRGDQVVAVNGHPVADGAALMRWLRQRQPGEQASFTLARRAEGRSVDVKLPLRRLSTGDFWATFVLPFAIGVTYLLIGAVVFFVKRTYESGLAMAMCIVASVFYMTTFNAHTSFTFSRLWITYPLLGPISLHLFAVFPGRLPAIHRPLVLGVPYAIVLALLIFGQVAHTRADLTALNGLLAGSFVACCFVADIALLTMTATRHVSEAVRNKARTIRVGLLVTVAAGIAWSLVMARIYPELLNAERVLMLSALFPVLLAYAVLKKDIFDLDIFLRTTTVYVTATVLLAGVYLAVVAVVGVAVQTWTERYYPEFMQNVEAVAISTIVAALIFHPLRLGVQRVVDRFFFREKEAVRQAVAVLARELAQTEQLPELGRRLSGQLQQMMRCRYVALLAPPSETGPFEVVGVAGAADSLRGVALERDALEQLVGQDDDPVDLRTAEPGPHSTAAVLLAGAGVSLLVPLRVSRSLVGVVLLGPRHHGDVYRKLERRSLAGIAAPAALALRNALLLRAHASRERLAALGQLAAVIIHEIKNPLGIIKISSGTLRKRFAAGDTSHDLASFIETEVDRMNRAIAQFLAFARPQPPVPGRVDLAELVARTLRVMHEELAADGVAVVEELAGPVIVRADPDQLQQVLLNLLTNAREALAGQPRGRVEVRLRDRPEQRAAELAVTNDGPAIPAAVRARIFEPFVTTRPGGTGLGLAIAKQVLEEQGGRIAARSEEGQTTFTVTVPLWDEEAAPERAPAGPG